MVQTKKPHVSRNLSWCWMTKKVVPVEKRLHAIRYLRPTCRKTDLMVDYKKKKKLKKKVLELYESYTTIIFFYLKWY